MIDVKDRLGPGLAAAAAVTAAAKKNVRKRGVDYDCCCYYCCCLLLSLSVLLRTLLFVAVAPPQRCVGDSSVSGWETGAVPVFRLARRQSSFSRIDYWRWCECCCLCCLCCQY